MKKLNPSTSEIHPSKSYGDFSIVKYNSSTDVIVRFVATGYETKTAIQHVRTGAIKDPLHPVVQGVGFIGIGEYRSSGHIYSAWHGMLERCYSKGRQSKQPSYTGCTVCPEWHNFQVFAEWFVAGFSKGTQLDKDIKFPGNKVYSPETCIFVTNQVNSEFATAKHYKLIDPENNVIEIYNMRKFCRDNGITRSSIISILSGEQENHKGWRKA